MEKSVYSSIQQFPQPLSNSFPSASAAVEESGWTAYLDDPASNDAYSFATSSLLSDAASHALPLNAVDPLNIPKKLTLKLLKQPQSFIDASLEDTASSPDNSPKVTTTKKLP